MSIDSTFDPAGHGVDAVKKHLAGLPDDEAGATERQRILDAEAAGAARVGIVGRSDDGPDVEVRLLHASRGLAAGSTVTVDQATASRLVRDRLADRVE